MFLDIADVAAQSGVAPSALRYYERRRLIEALSRKELRRHFTPDVLTRLALIRLCQNAGFTLDDIATLLPGSETFSLDRDRLSARADAIDSQIADLQTLCRACA